MKPLFFVIDLSLFHGPDSAIQLQRITASIVRLSIAYLDKKSLWAYKFIESGRNESAVATKIENITTCLGECDLNCLRSKAFRRPVTT